MNNKKKRSSKQNCDLDTVNTLEHKATEEIQKNTRQRRLYKRKAYSKQTFVIFILSILWPTETGHHQANHF